MNRKEMRWAPFESLTSSKEVLKDIERARSKRLKPILSEDELKEIETTLLISFHTKEKVIVQYYYEGLIYEKISQIVSLNKANQKITFQDHTSLYFDQVIHIKEQ